MLRINSLNEEKKVVQFLDKSRDKMLRIHIKLWGKKVLTFFENEHTRVMFMLSQWSVLFSVCSGVGGGVGE